MRELVESLGGGLGSWPIHAFLYTAVLAGAVLLVERRLGSLAARETWLRAALFGGVLVATAQLALDGRWTVARLPLEAGKPAVIGLASGPVGVETPPPAVTATSASASPMPVPTPDASDPWAEEPATAAAPWPWLDTLVALWAVLAVARVSRLALRRRRARAWLASRRPLRAPLLRERVRRIAPRGVRVRLSEHAELESPVALGAREICLPARALADLDDEALDAVLAHELEHLRRRDDRWSFGAQVAQALLLPFAAATRRRLQHVAELACDARAAEAVGELAVARGLERVASWVGGRPPLALGAAMARADSDLVSRVERVLERGGDLGRGARRNTAAAVALVGALACVGPRAAQDTPYVAEDPPGDPLEVPETAKIVEASEPDALEARSDFFVGRGEYAGDAPPPVASLEHPQVHVGVARLLVRDAGSTRWFHAEDPAIAAEGRSPRPLTTWLAEVAAGMERSGEFPSGRLSISAEDESRMHDVLTVMERCADFEVRIWNLVLVDESGREQATPLPHDLAHVPAAVEEPEGSGDWTSLDAQIEDLVGQLETVERPEVQIRVVEPGTKLALDGGPWSGEGPWRYDTDRVLEYRAGPRKMILEDLEAWLTMRAEESPGVSVILDCKPGVVYRDVQQVLDVLTTLDLAPTWVGRYAEVFEDPPAGDK